MLNVRGLATSLRLQKLVTIAPVVFLLIAGAVILGEGLLFDDKIWDVLSANLNFHGAGGMPGPGVFAAAMIPVFFTYTGWNVTLYLAEDIKDPHRVIPLSMILGLGAVALVYFLFCMVLLATIPFQDMLVPNPGDISSRALGAIFGAEARTLMSFIIAMLILGTLNTTILAGSRVYLAMARDGIFFSQAKHLHPKHGTPSWSLWAQGLWACGLVIIFLNFDTILNLTTLIMVFLSMMTISSVFVLRWRHGKNHQVALMERSLLVRALGYPYFPAFYVLATALILIGTIVYREDGRDQALLGLVVSLAGFLVYYLWRAYLRSRPNGS
jgi:APA family basic amino acid/polyamine antiporter